MKQFMVLLWLPCLNIVAHVHIASVCVWSVLWCVVVVIVAVHASGSRYIL